MKALASILSSLILCSACTDRAVDAADGQIGPRRDGRTYSDTFWLRPPDLWSPAHDIAPPPPKHAIFVLASEQTYLSSAGAPSVSHHTLGMLVVDVTDPDPVMKPDFIDAPKPPNCVVYRWKKGDAPNRAVYNAGTFSVTGHKVVQSAGLSTVVTCPFKKVGPKTPYGYQCWPFSPAVGLGGTWMGSSITVTATGGGNVTPFSDKTASPPSSPTISTDLNRINPLTGVTIKWNPNHKSALMTIILQARLQDNSMNAELWCTALTILGSKKIPAGALAALPKPTAKSGWLMMTVHVIGAQITGKTETWGSHSLAVGRGSFGVSCLKHDGTSCF